MGFVYVVAATALCIILGGIWVALDRIADALEDRNKKE